MKHDWQFFADGTAKCRRCGMAVISSGAFIEGRRGSCNSTSTATYPTPMMTTDKETFGAAQGTPQVEEGELLRVMRLIAELPIVERGMDIPNAAAVLQHMAKNALRSHLVGAPRSAGAGGEEIMPHLPISEMTNKELLYYFELWARGRKSVETIKAEILRKLESVAPSPAQGTPEPPNATELYRKALERIAAQDCGISHQGWGGPTCLGVIAHATKHPKKYEANHRQDILNFKHCCDSCFAKSTLETAALAGPQNGQGWVKVEDGLPEPGERVEGIVSYTTSGYRAIAYRTEPMLGNGTGWTWRHAYASEGTQAPWFTHWRKILPAPPTGTRQRRRSCEPR